LFFLERLSLKNPIYIKGNGADTFFPVTIVKIRLFLADRELY
jgi:hypothetical protein